MKILLDESIDVQFRTRIVGHDVFTVAYMGWKGLGNGALLARAAADGFEAMITADKAMPQQQNQATLPLSLVVVYPNVNNLKELDLLVPNLLKALNHLPQRSVVHVKP
jgi:hypothetical protein